MTFSAALLTASLMVNGQLPADHPPMNGAPMAAQPAPARDEALFRELEKMGALAQGAGKSFEVASGAGRLFYVRGRFSEATRYFAEAVDVAEPTRKLFLAERAKVKGAALPAAASVGCGTEGGQVTFASLQEKAKAFAEAKKPAEASACAKAALEPALIVGELLAQSLFQEKKQDNALAQLDRVLELDAERPSALYTRGMMRFDTRPDDVKVLQGAKTDLQRYLKTDASSPRALFAQRVLARIDQAIPMGGVSELDRKLAKEAKASLPAMAAPPMAPMMGAMGGGSGSPSPGVAPPSAEMVEAVQNTERTPELEAGLAKLVEEGEEHLAKARFQDALDAYKRVVPFQPENGRAKAGMAWALVGLQKPTADRVWMVAVQSDPGAVDRLGDTLQKKGDGSGAKALWRKLSDSSPDYAAKSGLSLKLR